MAQRVGRGIALLFLDRSTRRGWVVSSTSRPHFTPGKEAVPILQEAGWASGLVWTDAENPLWFYKHQHDNRVRSKLSVACQRWWFQWLFWFLPSVPGYLREEEEHKSDPWRNPIERNHMGLHLENEVARRVASDHHKGCTYRAPIRYVTKTWRVVLLNKKKYIYCYLTCIVYDKLLKPRQLFRVTLYFD